MPKEEWGVKRVCPTTGKRFYDLNKDPIVSPYTGELIEINEGKSSLIASGTEDAEALGAKAGVTGEPISSDDSETEIDLEDDDVLDDEDDGGSVSLESLRDVAEDSED